MGTLIRNLIYQDDENVIFADIEVDGRIFIHSLLSEPWKPSSMRLYKQILAELGSQLKARGYNEFYTMADSANGFRFNELLGFKPAYEVWNDYLEIMVKEID